MKQYSTMAPLYKKLFPKQVKMSNESTIQRRKQNNNNNNNNNNKKLERGT